MALRLLVLSNKEIGGGAFVRWLREGAADIEILHDRQLCQSETDTDNAIAHIRSLHPDVIMVRSLPPLSPDERTNYHRFQQMCHTLSETLAFLDPPEAWDLEYDNCLLYTSPSPRDGLLSRMPSSA